MQENPIGMSKHLNENLKHHIVLLTIFISDYFRIFKSFCIFAPSIHV